MRVALCIEYDGRGFHGWQRQPTLPTLQAAVEAALATIAAEPVSVVCAGRTDTGVHALHQVVHFDTSAERPMRAWVFGTNRALPDGIAVTHAQRVPEDFHARFSATARRYHYHFLLHPVRSAIHAGRVLWECRELDVARMREAASLLVGEHDFSSFRGQGCQAKSPVRTVNAVSLTQRGSLLTLSIEANAFLLHMVRNIVGVLLDIGLGRQPASWVSELLTVRDRSAGGVTASPHGLYLAAIRYPERFAIPVAGPGLALDSLWLAGPQTDVAAHDQTGDPRYNRPVTTP